MNFKTAAVVAGGAFLISFLCALIGGVSFFDMVVRAFFWAVVAGGLTLGAEALLRWMVPELFQGTVSSPEPTVLNETEPNRVDISLEEEASPRGFVQEVEESDEGEVFSRERERRRQTQAEAKPAVSAAPPVDKPEAGSGPQPGSGPSPEEDLPEIGAFLDSFRSQESPASGEEEAPPAPSQNEAFAPSEAEISGFSAPSSGVSVFEDGQQHDPAVLAKAVQTVLKKDQ